MVDLTLAFASKDASLKGLQALGFLTAQNQSVSGVEIDWTPITVTRVPAVLDKDGKVTTPAVIDARYFVNVRISGAKALLETAGKTPDPVKGADVYADSVTGALFKSGSAKTDYVATRMITLSKTDCELIDPKSWPSGSFRCWQ